MGFRVLFLAYTVDDRCSHVYLSCLIFMLSYAIIPVAIETKLLKQMWIVKRWSSWNKTIYYVRVMRSK